MIDNRDFLKVPSEVLHVRRVGAEVLRGVGRACYLAAAVVAVLIVALWVRTDGDFPGRSLFALLPLLVAGVSLWASADKAERGTA